MSALSRDLPPSPGMHLVAGGAQFAVFAENADAVTVVVQNGDGMPGERRYPLTDRAHGWWWGLLDGVLPGQRYAVHASGPHNPASGLHYDPDIPLLDPYARAIDERGLGVVISEAFDWEGDQRLHRSWSDTVIYEMHVRGMTMRHPDVPPHLRGTYAGLAHPVVVEHLRRLGVTAVEFLPVHASASEEHLTSRGLGNYWGYNTLGFFAPEPRLAAARDPQGVVDEFKGMVKLLHRAGIEVLLDVVYNHTAEQGVRDGRTLSWRGLDNRTYYRLDGAGRDVDFSGCGNTLDLSHPEVIRLVLDSLRYWVQDCHVDGFRFDLAVALARGKDHAFDRDHPFLVAVRTDPVLSTCKLIAEPWDVGPHGWRTGQFPPPFAEWNDRFRDDVRTFWLTDVAARAHHHRGHGVRHLATRLAGSEDFFSGRGPIASVNFVTAHDGFTMADLTAYNEKHNEANGEGNRDGSSHNRSWNHGIEGPTDDQHILDRRRQTIRNLLGTLLLAHGVPMINAGDEFGRTQRGNNNPYCQDNELTWLNWQHKPWQRALLATVEHLTSLRRQLPVLRQRHFLTGESVTDGGPADVSWYGGDGEPMTAAHWEDPSGTVLQMLLSGPQRDRTSVLLVFNGAVTERMVVLPPPPNGPAYHLLWDSALESPVSDVEMRDPGPVHVAACSIQVWGCDPPA
ncbi:MAG: glycogen debranching protein GlgX [Tetrasphaera sp.]